MERGINLQRVSSPPAVFGLGAMIVVALLLASGLWIRNANLRPETQRTASESILSCVEHYAGPESNTVYSMDRLWPAYQLCDSIKSRQLLYEEQVIRNEDFVFQRYENTIIMLMVVSITVSGVILAGLQLLASYKLAATGKGTLSEGGEITISQNTLAVKSSVVGVVILGISFAFFLVFVQYVYTFTPAGNNGAGAYLAPMAAPTQNAVGNQLSTERLPNVGKAFPAPQQPLAQPSVPKPADVPLL